MQLTATGCWIDYVASLCERSAVGVGSHESEVAIVIGPLTDVRQLSNIVGARLIGLAGPVIAHLHQIDRDWTARLFAAAKSEPTCVGRGWNEARRTTIRHGIWRSQCVDIRGCERHRRSWRRYGRVDLRWVGRNRRRDGCVVWPARWAGIVPRRSRGIAVQLQRGI